MSYAAIAERYARAIFELGSETGQLTQMTDQIRNVAETYSGSPELKSVLDNPTMDDARREALLKDLCSRLGVSQNARNALRLLVARRRLRALPEISKVLRRMSDEKAGVLRATVTSAKPLPETYYRQLVDELGKKTSRKILLEKKQDPSLIAGVVTRIGDNTIDGSLKGRLAALERQLIAQN